MRHAKEGPKGRSTLHDVAARAGVSTTTASLVLSGKATERRISDQTLEQVQRAARELNYAPSLLHRSMRQGRTNLISFYNGFRNRDPEDIYMDRLASAIQHAGGACGYDILVHCNFRSSLEESYESLNGGLTDGLIVFGPPANDPLVELLKRSGLPMVVINPRADDPELFSVTDDRATGIGIVAKTVLDAGHRSIAAVVRDSGGVIDPTRRAAELKHQLQVRSNGTVDFSLLIWGENPEATIREACSLPSKPTALFVWHDRTAYRLLETCEAMGVCVPDRLSLMGYDGLPWPSNSPHRITSVAVNLNALAQQAVELLHDQIEGREGPCSRIIPVQFFPGTTVGSRLALHSSKEGPL